jgi:putative ABC transport system ATP-binding protein
MQRTPLLKCRNISKSFLLRKKTIQVLKGADLDVYPGEMIVIKGRSGEGKSVLQWILSGIDVPDSGEILFEGVSYSKFSREEMARLRRNKIGLIFQNFNLIESWTALENVESALLDSGLSSDEKRKKAVSILERMELGNRLDNLPVELSIGQQQRVAIARALINEPSLIIADEPTGSIDDETASEMLTILLSYLRERSAAMVVTTHGHFIGEHLADRVLHIKGGKLI